MRAFSWIFCAAFSLLKRILGMLVRTFHPLTFHDGTSVLRFGMMNKERNELISRARSAGALFLGGNVADIVDGTKVTAAIISRY